MSKRDGGDWDIFVMDSDGTNVVQLTTNDSIGDQWPYWSPDGSQIVFSSDKDGDFEIYIMNTDGSNVTQITDNDAKDI